MKTANLRRRIKTQQVRVDMTKRGLRAQGAGGDCIPIQPRLLSEGKCVPLGDWEGFSIHGRFGGSESRLGRNTSIIEERTTMN